MFNKSKKEKDTYGIVGLGRFGFALAVELGTAGADLIVIDRDEEKVRELREYADNAYVVKTLDKKTLEECGMQNCDIAVVCIGEQLDTSILTTLNLVSLNIPTVIAKATSLEHGQILSKLGAKVVYPEHDMAVRLAHQLETSKILDFVQLSRQLNISKLEIPEKIVGKTVLAVNLRGRFGINIIALETNNSLIETVNPEYVFKRGDILFISGNKARMNNFTEWVEKP